MTFSGLQVRRDTRALRAGEYRGVPQSFCGPWMTITGNAERVDLILRGIDDSDGLDRAEVARIRFAQTACLRAHENAWFQHEIGIPREEDWKAVLGDMEYRFPGPACGSAGC